jgi:hypothetical protein
MLVVTIEEWPNGDETGRRVMGIAHIIANGTVTRGRENFTVRLFRWGRNNPGMRAVWKRGSVEGFDCTDSTPWDLVTAALREVVGPRTAAPPLREIAADGRSVAARSHLFNARSARLAGAPVAEVIAEIDRNLEEIERRERITR